MWIFAGLFRVLIDLLQIAVVDVVNKALVRKKRCSEGAVSGTISSDNDDSYEALTGLNSDEEQQPIQIADDERDDTGKIRNYSSRSLTPS